MIGCREEKCVVHAIEPHDLQFVKYLDDYRVECSTIVLPM